ncbi:hypothetical protein GGS21DRAFT_541641 [Xylaria nigripes]|nr:hypothetical protein GGS21DRAFT_541641 [Xylaria nigripes]
MSAIVKGPAATSPRPTKPPKILACVHCQYRKIKCDRQQPCSNCIKAKVACKPSTPAPTHKRRRPNQDLLERLSRCEQLLKQYAENNVVNERGSGPIPADSAELRNSSCASSANQLPSPIGRAEPNPTPTGKVIQEDGNVRFMDNSVRISFHDELAALRNIIDDDDEESEPSTVGLSPDNNAGMFLGIEDTTAVDMQDLHPNFSHVFQMWKLFTDRVNPLTKVVHMPTLQPYVMDAAIDINAVPLPYQALLFSIYTIATVSLSSQECVQLLGMPRDDALSQFTRGTKLALTRANFLKNYNMTILQALTLYMLSLNDRADSNSAWIMGGTVMRIAQKMGYHRDGEQFNLSPFETEMRRRLWWQVITQDSRFAMFAGLNQSWVPSNWDTKFPQNLNDADLSPSSTEPLVPKEGPTEMAFVLMVYQYQAFTLRSHRQFEAAFMALRSDGGRGPIDTYRTLLDEIDRQLGEFEKKYVDPTAGGVQLAASAIRPLFVDKMRSVMVPMSEQPEWGSEVLDQVDSIFKSFVESQAKKTIILDMLADTGLVWYVRAGVQPDALLLFTARLYRRPTGKLTERAWAALQSMYYIHPELFDVSQKKADRQAHFTLKAWTVREQALAQSGQRIEVPEFILRLRQLVSSPRQTVTHTDSPGSTCQAFLPQQTSAYQQMPFDLGDMNQYLVGDMGAPNFSMDMWGNLLMDDNAGAQEQVFPHSGLLDFSKLDFM